MFNILLFNWNRAIHVVLAWQIAAASTVHFASNLIIQPYSSIPYIVLEPIPNPSLASNQLTVSCSARKFKLAAAT